MLELFARIKQGVNDVLLEHIGRSPVERSTYMHELHIYKGDIK